MITHDTTATMSEARYNDLVYMILKKTFFEPCGMSPRECDIRICMQMGCPEMLNKAGIMAAILLPNEKAPNSHDIQYTINYRRVFEECIEYIEDHWMKQTFDEAIGQEGTHEKMWQWLIEPNSVIDCILQTEEKLCGVYTTE